MNAKDLDEMEKMTRHAEIILTIVLTIGKNLILLIALSTAATFAIAIYNYISGNTIGSLVSLGFGAGGVIFLVQMRQTQKQHYKRRQRYQEERRKQQKYSQAGAA